MVQNGRGREDIKTEAETFLLYEDLKSKIPKPRDDDQGDYFLYLMGPYTAFDASYVVDDVDPDDTHIDSGAFDPDQYDEFIDILQDLRDHLRDKHGIRAFIATDLDIPTPAQASEMDDPDISDLKRLDDSPGIPPMTQTIQASLYADSVVFLLDESGLNNGVSQELGGVLHSFNIHPNDVGTQRKPRHRFQVYSTKNISSSTVKHTPATYPIDVQPYSDLSQVKSHLSDHIEEVWRKSRDPDDDFPVFRGQLDDYYSEFHIP